MRASLRAVIPACEAAADYLQRRGRDKEAEIYIERAAEQDELFAAASEERASIDEDDAFLPHELPSETEDSVRQSVLRHGWIERAYLVRKRLRYFSEWPLYVLVVTPKKTRRRGSAAPVAALVETLAGQLDLPGEVAVILPGRKSRLESRVAKVEDAALLGGG
jgi:hypothetical protein